MRVDRDCPFCILVLFLVCGLFHGDFKHLLAKPDDIFFDRFVMFENGSFDERGDLVCGDVVLEDEISRRFPCALEHQDALAKRCIDLVYYEDNTVSERDRVEQRGQFLRYWVGSMNVTVASPFLRL